MVTSTASGGQKGHSVLYGSLFCTVVIVLASIVLQMRDLPPLNEYLSKKISSTKPYETFEDFYPHYIREHSQTITRQWHYVGTTLFLLYILTQPLLLIPILSGGFAAYAAIPFFRHQSNGLTEIALFATVYILGGKLLTRSFKKTCVPLLLGYGFAWIGHFYFEHNKPATFIYPSYSLMGDFRMMFDAIRQQRF